MERAIIGACLYEQVGQGGGGGGSRLVARVAVEVPIRDPR